MGCATLINVVLDCQLVYAMAALPIPPGVLNQVDRRRQSFLWSGSGFTTGAKNLVAWEHVCDVKDRGGLGLKDIGIQNTCLMLKMIHRLHSDNDSSWARWVRQNASIASLRGNLNGHHWDTLRSFLPLYRAITTVRIADGNTTSFWHNVWDAQDSLAERFPELLSHCRDQELTVKQAYEGELQRSLTTRQSAVATTQLAQVLGIMEQHTLAEGRDRRLSMMIKKNGDLDSSLLYKALKTAHSSPDAWTKFVWNNKAPPRVKFFAWLLSQGRIQCKTVLRTKGVVENTVCPAKLPRRHLPISSLDAHMPNSSGELSELILKPIGLSKQPKTLNRRTTYQQSTSPHSYYYAVGIYGSGGTTQCLGQTEQR